MSIPVNTAVDLGVIDRSPVIVTAGLEEEEIKGPGEAHGIRKITIADVADGGHVPTD